MHTNTQILFPPRSLIEQKRQQAMDMHLNFIVDQTEKYSSWLIESLATSEQPPKSLQSDHSPTTLTPSTSLATAAADDPDDDREFDGDECDSESDDESTIAREERLERALDDARAKEELRQLQLENEQSLDKLLKEYNLDEQYFKTEVHN